MKGPKEVKHYVQKHRKWLKACCWDDLFLLKLETCKKAFKRVKKINWKEWE